MEQPGAEAERDEPPHRRGDERVQQLPGPPAQDQVETQADRQGEHPDTRRERHHLQGQLRQAGRRLHEVLLEAAGRAQGVAGEHEGEHEHHDAEHETYQVGRTPRSAGERRLEDDDATGAARLSRLHGHPGSLALRVR